VGSLSAVVLTSDAIVCGAPNAWFVAVREATAMCWPFACGAASTATPEGQNRQDAMGATVMFGAILIDGLISLAERKE
jgi:hypothetical protein